MGEWIFGDEKIAQWHCVMGEKVAFASHWFTIWIILKILMQSIFVLITFKASQQCSIVFLQLWMQLRHHTRTSPTHIQLNSAQNCPINSIQLISIQFKSSEWMRVCIQRKFIVNEFYCSFAHHWWWVINLRVCLFACDVLFFGFRSTFS